MSLTKKLASSYAGRWLKLAFTHSVSVPEKLMAVVTVIGGILFFTGVLKNTDMLEKVVLAVGTVTFGSFILYRTFAAPFWIHKADVEALENERKETAKAQAALQALKAERDNRLNVEMHRERGQYAENMRQIGETRKAEHAQWEKSMEILRGRLESEEKARAKERRKKLEEFITEGNILESQARENEGFAVLRSEESTKFKERLIKWESQVLFFLNREYGFASGSEFQFLADSGSKGIADCVQYLLEVLDSPDENPTEAATT
jgi:hypothetical protein